MIHPFASKPYVVALAAEKTTVELPGLGTWAIVNRIPTTRSVDAAGPYPFTPLSRSNSFMREMDELRRHGAVSFTVVTDALQDGLDWLPQAFDVVRSYKTKFLVDRRRGDVRFSAHHRREVRKARRACETRVIPLEEYLDEWQTLYQVLTQRHGLSGIHLFTRAYFTRLIRVPGLVSVGAFVADTLVSCHLWFIHGNHAYSHLGASSAEGYACGASYAVYDHSIAHLQDCTVIDLGGAADGGNVPSEGLARFKAGFANCRRRNWICGRILEPSLYQTLCHDSRIDPERTTFFPAYRTPQGGKFDVPADERQGNV